MLIDAGSFHRDFFMVGRALRTPRRLYIVPSLSARGDGGGAAEQYVPEQKDGAMGGSVTADAGKIRSD